MATLSNKYNKSPLTSPTGYDTYGLLGGSSVYTKYSTPVTTTKKKTTPTKKETKPVLASYPKSSGGSSSGGSTVSSYSGTLRPYLDAMLSAFNQGAEANKALAKSTYDSKVNNLNEILRQARENYEFTKGDLETSLRRYQEQNARNVENQRKAYLTDQAALESARLEADRQTRIDAAARGLGGSGLQQLAQLQNLLNQGQDISNLATSNEDVLDKLRTQLAEQTEDINTKKEQARRVLEAAETSNKTGLNELLDAYNAQIQGINADLARNIADAEYNFGQNAYSASRSGTGSSSLNEASILASAYGALEQDFDTDLAAIYRGKGSSKDKAEAAENLYDTYKKKSSELYGGYGSNYKSLQDINLSNFKTLKDYYKNK